MKEIIKKGTKTKATCEACGCYFSYEEEDVEVSMDNSSCFPGRVLKRSVTCPQCNAEIVLMQSR